MSIWKVNTEAVEFEYLNMTRVEAEMEDATTLVLYTGIMYNCNHKKIVCSYFNALVNLLHAEVS